MKSFILKRRNFKYIIYFLLILSLIFIYSEKGNATTINNFKRLNSNSNSIILGKNYLGIEFFLYQNYFGIENFLYNEYVLNFGISYTEEKVFLELLGGTKNHLVNNFFIVKSVGLKMAENITNISPAFQAKFIYRLNKNFELGTGIRKGEKGFKPVISLSLNY